MMNIRYPTIFFKSAALLLVTLAGSALAEPVRLDGGEVPQGQFVCHVIGTDGRPRIVGIQAFDLGNAEEAVTGALFRSTSSGGSVVECIDPVSSRFKDKAAQEQFERQPR